MVKHGTEPVRSDCKDGLPLLALLLLQHTYRDSTNGDDSDRVSLEYAYLCTTVLIVLVLVSGFRI